MFNLELEESNNLAVRNLEAWDTPSANSIKLNVDAAIMQNSAVIVVFDPDQRDNILKACSKLFETEDPTVAEARN